MKFGEFVYNLFFPSRCVYCGEVVPMGEYSCDACRSTLPRIQEPCLYCAEEKSKCTCAKKQGNADSFAAPFYYSGGVSRAVLKMKSKIRYVRPLAEETANTVKRVYADVDFDLVTCVPMHPKRMKQRGFNHAALLAGNIADLLAMPFKNTLKMIYEPKNQHSLSASLRSGNVKGIYDIINEKDVTDKNILLIDDIKTSGATLNECALMLKLYGARRVYAAVCAVSDKRRTAKQKTEKERK